MKNGIFRVVENDPEHVNVLSVMDEFPMDLARNAGIPTSGALCAKQTPAQVPNRKRCLLVNSI